MRISRRSLLGGVAVTASGLTLDAALLPKIALAQGPTFTPEQFGAKGDGATNDTAAFARLATAVNIAGGGTIVLRKTTYIVGQQRASLKRDDYWSFEPAPILRIAKCRDPLIIRGNGARIRGADGLRYGTFDSATGRRTDNPMPFTAGQIATPYREMIRIEDCSGPVEVADLELDGNIDRQQLGGPFGDVGRQIPHIGLALFNNRGDELVRNVHSHHHGHDGLYIDGIDRVQRPAPVRRIIGFRSEYNGRQGCSMTGGRGYQFQDCKFSHTGRSRSGVLSPPGAGLDLEAENGKINRDFTFINCEFVDNGGCGLVADTGDSEGALFRGCTFVGTTAWAAWPNKPRFRFDDCLFVGASVRAFGDPDPDRAAQFHNCRFRDDPGLSPTGKVYLGDNGRAPIFDLSSSVNVLFSGCDFELTGKGVLPWSWHAIYQDCRMRQRSADQAYPKGKYRGRSRIEANVDMYGTSVEGALTVNGRPLA
ncbi:MAG TPA: hypothetical protein VF628_08795 [Allosphingosinicella sp.]|jgi:hypothetical protein